MVDVEGDLSFEGNTVQELGQLSILSFGQILLQPGVNITFIRNQGRYAMILCFSSSSSKTGHSFQGLVQA